MADVARGSVLLTPKFDNLMGSINRQLSGAFKGFDKISSSAGSRAGKSMGAGFVKSGAIIGAASAITSKAFDSIASSMGNAINRVDTMANFPKVMQNLGYSSADAQRSIDRMSAAIDGMPTSLDSITGMVQQLAPLTGGLGQATSIGIAFNNALLAGGASAFDASRAMQQYSQMLSKGKPELQDWKTLQEVMPGQLNQIAQALLGPTAKSKDLYDALKSGNVTMDQFNDAMVKLNDEGVNGFASFAEQAKTATGGIGTALTNVQNRISKAMATIIDAIGQTSISGAINAFSSQFAPMADAVAGVIERVKGYIDDFIENVRRIEGASGIFSSALGAIRSVVGSVVASFQRMVNSIGQATGISGAFSGIQASASDLAFAAAGAAGQLKGFIDSFGGVDAIAMKIQGAFAAMGGAIAPAVQSIASALGSIDFAGLAPKVAGAVAAFGAFNAARGPISALAGALGTVPAAFTRVQQAILPFRASLAMVGPVQTFKNALSLLPGALGAIASPVGIAVAAVAALAAGFAYFYTTSAPFREAINGIIASLGASLAPVIQQIAATVTSFVSTVMPVVMQIAATVAPVIQQILVILTQLAAIVVQVMAQILAAVLPVATGIIAAVMPIVSAILSVLAPAIQMILSVVSAVLPAVGALFSSVFSVISAVVTTVMGVVGAIVGAVMGTINAVISGDLGSIKGIWSGAWNTMRSLLGNAWNGIKSGVSSGISAVMSFISTIPGRITGFFAGAGSWLLDAGASIINGLKEGIMGAIGSVTSAVSSAVGKIRDLFPFSPAKEGPFSGHGYTTWSGRALITDFGKSVRKYAPRAETMVAESLAGVRDMVAGPGARLRLAYASAPSPAGIGAEPYGGGSGGSAVSQLLEEFRAYRREYGDVIEERTPVTLGRDLDRRIRKVAGTRS